MTTDGIGSTIPVFKHKQVNTLTSTRAKLTQLLVVLCRSSDSILPDFSQSDNVGEIFFDVSVLFSSRVMIPMMPFSSQICFPQMARPRFRCMISLIVESISHTASLSPCVASCRSLIAYNDETSQGSDFWTVYVRPTSCPLAPGNGSVSNDDGRLPDELKFVKFSSISWTKDSQGFFYQVCCDYVTD